MHAHFLTFSPLSFSLSHTQTQRSGGVFSASEKESAPVARQPLPPCSLAHSRLRDPNTHRNKLCSSLCPLCATCWPEAITLKTPFLTGFFLFFSPEKGCQAAVLKRVIQELCFMSGKFFVIVILHEGMASLFKT